MTMPETSPRRFNWLKAALVASLAVNLLFVGAGVARFMVGEGPERMSGLSQMQLIPRKFFGDLGGPRKAELLQVMRDYGPAFRDGRRAARDQVMAVAAALEAEPYDAAMLKTAVDEFAARNGALATQGADAALSLIGKLSPEERKLLAQRIRERGDKGDRGRRDKDG
jgi:uncharacterized membrane protein